MSSIVRATRLALEREGNYFTRLLINVSNSFCSSSINPSSACSSSSSRENQDDSEGRGESSDGGAQEILDTVISSAVQASEAKVRKVNNLYTIDVC